MPHTNWLVTLNEEQPTMIEGLSWRFWWTTQRDRATGEVRRRGDGKPYTPMWLPGDDVFVRYAGAESVIAWLILDGKAEWIAEKQWFETDSTGFRPQVRARQREALVAVATVRGRLANAPGPAPPSLRSERLSGRALSPWP